MHKTNLYNKTVLGTHRSTLNATVLTTVLLPLMCFCVYRELFYYKDSFYALMFVLTLYISFLGAKVPTGNFCSEERKYWGAKSPDTR